jgi:hypothetical protein
MTIHGIIFTDDAVLIEYSEASQGSFPVTSQITIPYREAQSHEQLAQDLQELMQDADTLLDSAMLARMTGSAPIQEMGRQ